jgi:hypothetical protein
MVELWDLPPMMALATRKNPVRLNEPTFSFAGATTLEWLELAVDETDFASGLLNRFLFFSAPPDARVRGSQSPGLTGSYTGAGLGFGIYPDPLPEGGGACATRLCPKTSWTLH